MGNYYCTICGWSSTNEAPHSEDHAGLWAPFTMTKTTLDNTFRPKIGDFVPENKNPGIATNTSNTTIMNPTREIRTVSATGGEKGAKLARFDLIPPFVLKKLAEHYGRGALKYADHNWRRGYKWSLSISALHRHMNAFEDGEDYDVCLGHETDCAFVDKDGKPFEGVPGVSCYNHTGNHHLDGVNFHGFALRYFAEYFPDYDDRFKFPTKKD